MQSVLNDDDDDDDEDDEDDDDWLCHATDVGMLKFENRIPSLVSNLTILFS